jgi:hypothetical protein
VTGDHSDGCVRFYFSVAYGLGNKHMHKATGWGAGRAGVIFTGRGKFFLVMGRKCAGKHACSEISSLEMARSAPGLSPSVLRSPIQRPEGRCSLPNAQSQPQIPSACTYERGPVRGTPLRWDDSSGVEKGLGRPSGARASWGLLSQGFTLGYFRRSPTGSPRHSTSEVVPCGNCSRLTRSFERCATIAGDCYFESTWMMRISG